MDLDVIGVHSRSFAVIKKTTSEIVPIPSILKIKRDYGLIRFVGRKQFCNAFDTFSFRLKGGLKLGILKRGSDDNKRSI